MSATLPSPRRLASALAVLHALPPAALADLAERLIDRLDALDAPGMDLEPDSDDCCEAGDDDPASSKPCMGVRGMFWGPGDPADAEPDADGEAGPHDEGPWWTPTKGPDGCCPMQVRAA